MDIHDLVNHLPNASLPGFGAVIAAWLAWRFWRRLFRAALACLVIGAILYVAFPGAVRQLVHDEHGGPTSSTGGPS